MCVFDQYKKVRGFSGKKLISVWPIAPWQLTPTNGKLHHTRNHELSMILFWLMCVSLVLGGMIAWLWFSGVLSDFWIRVIRRPALVRRSVSRHDCNGSGIVARRDGYWPPFGVVTRAGPPPQSPVKDQGPADDLPAS